MKPKRRIRYFVTSWEDLVKKLKEIHPHKMHLIFSDREIILGEKKRRD